mgnify:CR=1 FL=1
MRGYRFSPPQTAAPDPDRGRVKPVRVARWTAAVVAGLGCYSLEAAAHQGSRPAEAVLLPVMAASLVGLGLLIAAMDLWYRKRAGWFVAMVLLYALALVQLLSGWNLEAGAVFLVATVILFPAGPVFYRRWRELPLTAALRRMAFLGAVPLVYGFGGLSMIDRTGFGRRLDAWEAATAAVRFVRFGGLGMPVPLTAQADVLVLSIGALSAVAVLYALWIVSPRLCRELDLPAFAGGAPRNKINGRPGVGKPAADEITNAGSEHRRIVA